MIKLLGNLWKTISLVINSREECQQEPGNGFCPATTWLRQHPVDKNDVFRVRNCKSRFQVVSSESMIAGIIVGMGLCLYTRITPRHTPAHVAAYGCVWMIPLHISPAGSSPPSHIIIPLSACASMPSGQALEGQHWPDLNDCPHNLRNSYLYMHLCMF